MPLKVRGGLRKSPPLPLMVAGLIPTTTAEGSPVGDETAHGAIICMKRDRAVPREIPSLDDRPAKSVAAGPQQPYIAPHGSGSRIRHAASDRRWTSLGVKSSAKGTQWVKLEKGIEIRFRPSSRLGFTAQRSLANGAVCGHCWPAGSWMMRARFACRVSHSPACNCRRDPFSSGASSRDGAAAIAPPNVGYSVRDRADRLIERGRHQHDGRAVGPGLPTTSGNRRGRAAEPLSASFKQALRAPRGHPCLSRFETEVPRTPGRRIWSGVELRAEPGVARAAVLAMTHSRPSANPSSACNGQ